MSAADSAHHRSACIATTEHMPTQTLTEVEIRRTDGSLHTYIHTYIISVTRQSEMPGSGNVL